ncbi:MAG: hypothetical protein OH319_03510 [Candidatus Parvarchaeota archaeon]|nr:hypothetical protein [Candidatus Jingweiarchaeum tengchongense]MCW1304572.1 hypothetical protein [Candidatus Jingweiarchaeum tengchongense]MCW1310244.1 hypothetical protein [Candidatus Jingweiarchaeum tengchongense]
MKFFEIKKILEKMKFKEDSIYNKIKELIINGEIFRQPMYSEELATKISDATLKKIKSSVIATYMKPFVKRNIVKTKSIGKRRIWYGSWLNLDEKILSYEFPIPDELIKKLGRRFEKDFNDLKLIWNRSGNCMAFLLRRLLEKAIYFSFAKQGMIDKLKDPDNPSRFVGLGRMIDIATQEKAKDGTNFLTSKIVSHLKRIKFLGDEAAHNFLTEIYPKQIQIEVNFIVSALNQLSSKL